MRAMQLVEIRTEIPVGEVEAVDTVLLETESAAWNISEDVLEKRAWVLGIFESEELAEENWQQLVAILPEGVVGEKEKRLLEDSDWRDSYKAHFKAWQFGRLHWVPVWERETFVPPKGDEVLWLDPGLAFGTGNHETTRLCVERLVAWSQTHGVKGRVIDAGCGSGILALSAAKLGFERIYGFDNDEEAIRVSEENAVDNDLDGCVEFATGDLVTGLVGRQAELVLANILANVLTQFVENLTEAVAPDGQLVLSGILAAESEAVRDVFAKHVPNWTNEIRMMGEWSDVVFNRRD